MQLPEGFDPDSFILKNGAESFKQLLDMSGDYITFLVDHLSKTLNVQTPAGKNELVQNIAKQIRLWPHPLMVYESLKKLAQLTRVPEEMVGLGYTLSLISIFENREMSGLLSGPGSHYRK